MFRTRGFSTIYIDVLFTRVVTRVNVYLCSDLSLTTPVHVSTYMAACADMPPTASPVRCARVPVRLRRAGPCFRRHVSGRDARPPSAEETPGGKVENQYRTDAQTRASTGL